MTLLLLTSNILRTLLEVYKPTRPQYLIMEPPQVASNREHTFQLQMLSLLSRLLVLQNLQHIEDAIHLLLKAEVGQQTSRMT